MYGQVTIRDTSPTEFDKLSLLRIPRKPQGPGLQPESGDHVGAKNVIFGKWSLLSGLVVMYCSLCGDQALSEPEKSGSFSLG